MKLTFTFSNSCSFFMPYIIRSHASVATDLYSENLSPPSPPNKRRDATNGPPEASQRLMMRNVRALSLLVLTC